MHIKHETFLAGVSIYACQASHSLHRCHDHQELRAYYQSRLPPGVVARKLLEIKHPKDRWPSLFFKRYPNAALVAQMAQFLFDFQDVLESSQPNGEQLALLRYCLGHASDKFAFALKLHRNRINIYDVTFLGRNECTGPGLEIEAMIGENWLDTSSQLTAPPSTFTSPR
ncbi:hypothetical protein KSF73_15185 [Burkholderiaceae bacterium DAT-1]|nr:hypothetical protein [Burkholderiaceae bacterium DAT-1]